MKKLTSLRIASPSLPNQVTDIENLETLTLIGFEGKYLPEWMYSLKNLRKLSILGSRHVIPIPESIQRLPKLESLIVK